MKLEFSEQIFEKYSNITFHKYASGGSREVTCRRKETTILTVAFRNFGYTPNDTGGEGLGKWDTAVQEH